MDCHERSHRERTAYPDGLRCRESKLLGMRPQANGTRGFRVGLALSGGGLRSATFSLGIVQALARMGVLGKVDALSTVSGGGYLGSMIGRLFQRRSVCCVRDVERALLPEGRDGTECQTPGERIATGSVSRWLRDNGNHLAPNGAGDLLLGGTVILRNWVSMQVVLVALFLAGFTLMQMLRHVGASLDLGTVGWLARVVPDGPWSPWFAVATLPFGVAVLLGLLYWIWQCIRKHGNRRTRPSGPSSGHDGTLWLKYSLLVVAALVGAAIVDTLGQAAYVYSRLGELGEAAVASASAITAFALGARTLATIIFGKAGTTRPRIPLRAVAGVFALVVLVAWLTAVNALSHGIAWDWGLPHDTPCELAKCSSVPVRTSRCLLNMLYWFLGLTGFSLLLYRRFLNDSSLQPLYGARIARAYLGASNPKRVPQCKPVTQVVDGDDAWMPWEAGKGAFKVFCKGAPLHFVNVTVNENVDNKTSLQRADRGGVGMAIGPAGISAGVNHHVVPIVDENQGEEHCSGSDRCTKRRSLTAKVYPDDPAAFRMFEYKSDGNCGVTNYEGERLTLGQWTGVSGAAFSTGLGSRTSLALSFLAGMFNVRLGYWWDSRVPPSRRCPGAKDAVSRRNAVGRVFSRMFPVQSHLLDEMFARFHGTGGRYWNLSDGGHFENMGAYELLRRRVPVIVIIDAEADPDYGFEGLGNLVRKARTDFDADIAFLGEEEIKRWSKKHCDESRYFGSLDMLRRRSRVDSATSLEHAGDAQSRRSNETDRTCESLVHAALAKVRYEGQEKPGSIMVYVKPTLVGDEPVDIQHYHREHADYPQQTTADQFFDEAQWESYRALGELIGRRVLWVFESKDVRKSLSKGL